MKDSLLELLDHAIDYAGLFPPAGLPLEEAYRNYAGYRKGMSLLMPGRFICPAARVAELRTLEEQFCPSDPYTPLAIVGRGGRNPQDFLDGVKMDFEEVVAGPTPWEGTYETRLPEGMTDVSALTELMTATAEQHRRCVLSDSWRSYFEVPFGENWHESVCTAGQAAADSFYQSYSMYSMSDVHSFGLKFRCGGLEPAAFPTPEQLAFAIRTWRDLDLVFLKFTAGLHHPIRHFNEGVRTHMHGFLNVLGAAVLSKVRGISEEQIRDILRDERPEDFVFTDQEFRWRELTATTREISEARTWVSSFGSCSFDEPRDDLRALGLL